MKIRRNTVGTALLATASGIWRPAHLKEILLQTLESGYEINRTKLSRIRPLPLGDERIHASGDVILNMAFSKGNTSLLEQYVMTDIAKRYDMRTFFEIGTFDGQTSYSLAKNLPHLQIFTLDLPPAFRDETALPMSENERKYSQKPVVGKRFLGTPEAGRITQFLGDSASFDYDPFKGKMDGVFVDGCHDSAYVKNDTERALTLIKPKGIILWHDFLTYDPVTRYLNTLARTLLLYRIEGTSLVLHFHNA